MTIQSQAKRIWRPWYALGSLPVCRSCNMICIVKRTQTVHDGSKIQHRYCPKCGNPFKTTYHPERDITVD